MVIAHNLSALMKTQVLEKSWSSKRMKAIRFSIIKLPGRVLKRSRALILRLTKNHPSLDLFDRSAQKDSNADADTSRIILRSEPLKLACIGLFCILRDKTPPKNGYWQTSDGQVCPGKGVFAA